MQVIYLHQHFSTPAGCSGTRSYEFARALVARGHDVLVICGSSAVGCTGLDGPFVAGKREGVVDGIRVVEFYLPYSNRHGFIRRAWTFVRFSVSSFIRIGSEPHAVLFATSTPLTAALPAIVRRVLLGRKAAPFVFEVRDLWPELPAAMGVIKNPIVLTLMKWLELAAYRAATGGIALAPGIRDGMVRGGLPRENIALIPNGCDLSLFEQNGLRTSSVERFGDLTFKGDDLVCVFSGAHGKANGLDAVLNAAEVLQARKEHGIHIVMIGDGSEKERLVAKAGAIGLSNVVFMDPLPKKQLVIAMRRADVGLQVLSNVDAFYQGTSPNKFFDYISAGIPVLVNYPGWLAELVDSEGAGVAVRPDDAGAFADALVLLRDDPLKRQNMGRVARRLAEDVFDRNTLSRLFAEALEAVAEGHTKLGEMPKWEALLPNLDGAKLSQLGTL